jgi:CheY-like chemotaxis protein
MSNRLNYLYVEDDPLSREIMETLMVKVVQVKHLTVFESSQDFMQQLKALTVQPDCILLDIHILPHDGYDLLKMLRSDPDYEKTRVIAVTASVMSNEVQQLKQQGFDGALAKPLDMLTFPDLIEKLEAGESIWQIV